MTSSFVIDILRHSSLFAPRSRTDRISPDAPCSCRQPDGGASNGRIFYTAVLVTDALASSAWRIVRSLRMKNSSSSSLLIFVVTSEFEFKTTAASRAFPISFSLSRLLDRLTDDAAQFQELRRSDRSLRGLDVRMDGNSCKWTEPPDAEYRQTSSAVKARIGASSRQSAPKTSCMTIWVARRRG